MQDNEDVSYSIIAAVSSGNLERVRELIDTFGLSHSKAWSNGYVLLRDAVQYNHVEVVKLLLTRGCEVNSKKCTDTPLHFAVIKDDVKIVEMSKSQIRRTPLHIAIENKKMEIIELLLNHGADANAIDYSGESPFHIAIVETKMEIVELLLKHGADVNAKDNEGKSPFHFAAENTEMEIVELLLKHGADVNATDNEGKSPFHFASETQLMEIVELLLKHGADVNAKDNEGKSPLLIATATMEMDIVELLLKHGADVNAIDYSGESPLLIATEKKDMEIVELLLNHGADVNIRCKRYRTLLDSTSSEGCKAILKHHIIKMKTANLYLSEENLLSISSIDVVFRNFQYQCQEEIAGMKSEKINNTSISFYDILTKGTSSLAIYMSNENILRALNSNDYKTKFPTYAKMIEMQFKKGMKRKELLEQGKKKFHLLFNNFPELPYVCIKTIFSYLSNEDLKFLINAREVQHQ